MIRFTTVTLTFTVLSSLAVGSLEAQTGKSPAIAVGPSAKYVVPRTPDGHPDLQGIWANRSVTPFERPKSMAGKGVLTAEEVAAIEKRSFESTDRDRRGGAKETDLARAYNDFWNERGAPPRATNRTSLVIDPADGQLPPYTSQAVDKFAAWAKVTGKVGGAATLVGPRLLAGGTSEEGVIDGLAGGADGRGVPSDSPEERGLGERCVSFGVPRLPGGYNNNVQIVQTAGHVAVLSEMGYETRVIPLDARPHVPATLQLWLGDARGHWEGDTLVVETTNFNNRRNFRGSFETFRLTERFTRTDADTIDYQITVDDPSTWTKPWTASIPLTHLEDEVPAIFEYACHEGNYGMVNLLRGQRTLEKAAAGSK